jgi:hypothetical protein
MRRKIAPAVSLAGLALALLAGSASAGSQVPGSTMELVFAGPTASRIGDQVAVRVECLGTPRGFCSGVLTLSRDGRHRSSPFSVRGGARASVFVPSPVAARAPAGKLHGVATTVEHLGAPVSRATYLLTR